MRRIGHPIGRIRSNTRHQRTLRIESLENRQVLSAAGWSTAIGGFGDDTANAVETDSLGNAYVGGFVVDEGDAGNQAFLAKFDSDGNEVWKWMPTTNSGGSSAVTHIAIDSTGNVFVAGGFSGDVEFATGLAKTADDTDESASDGFLAKYDAAGILQWVHQLSDPLSFYGSDLAIREDPFDGTHIYITGQNAQSLTFDQAVTVPNDLGHTAAYLIDVIDTGSSAVVVGATQVQDQGWIRTDGLAVNSSGDIYLIGSFDNDRYPIVSIGGAQLTSNGWDDAFLARFSSDLTPQWALHLGGGDNGNDSGRAVAVGGDGHIYVSGTFKDIFRGDVEIGGIPLQSDNVYPSVYIAKFVDTGTSADAIWAKNIGGGEGQGRSFANSLVVDESDGPDSASVYVAGTFNDTIDFDPDPTKDYLLTSTVPPSSSVHATDDQGFLLRLSGDGEFEDVWQFGDIVNDVAASAEGSIFATGRFDIDSSAMVTENLRSAGGEDGFVLRIDPDAPRVNLATGGVVREGAAATFNAIAQDIVDGDLSSQIDWTLDGVPYTADTSTVTINGLSVGSHTLVASVLDSDGITGSYSLSFYVVPTAPTGLIAASINGTSVTLNWLDHSAGETGFIIERSVKPKGNTAPVWEQAGEVGANITTFTDSNLTSGNYVYRVRAITEIAVDEVLCSLWSNELGVSQSDGNGGGGKGGGKPNK